MAYLSNNKYDDLMRLCADGGRLTIDETSIPMPNIAIEIHFYFSITRYNPVASQEVSMVCAIP